MNIPTLTLAGKTQASTYQRLVQISGSILLDGVGNTIDLVNTTSSYASQILDGGVIQLSGGTATVPSLYANPTNIILLSYYSVDGGVASICYQNIVTSISFDILSSNVMDVNYVSWVILKL